MSQIGVKCRKLSCRLSQIVETFFCRPLPAVPLGFRQLINVGNVIISSSIVHRGTKIRVFRVRFWAPFLPPFCPHFPPLSPTGPVHSPTTSPLFTSPCIPLFRLPENSDLGTPLIFRSSLVSCWLREIYPRGPGVVGENQNFPRSQKLLSLKTVNKEV